PEEKNVVELSISSATLSTMMSSNTTQHKFSNKT
ncbi:MAG: hypothetical protein ACI90V_005955, partial [Bacillariaceae sp.]